MTTCDICLGEFDSVSSTHVYISQTITNNENGSYNVEKDESYHVCPECRKRLVDFLGELAKD